MQNIYIDKPDNFFLGIVRSSFPGYNGRKFSLSIRESLNTNSRWEEGSRSYFAAVDLCTLQAVPLLETTFMDLGEYKARQSTPIPAGIAIVEHAIICGKDRGITIHIHPDNATKLLPAAENGPGLTREEKIVLAYTSGLKSSYAGISNYRFHEARNDHRITLDAWNAAKETLITRKLLNKAGAITPDGRNTVSTIYSPGSGLRYIKFEE